MTLENLSFLTSALAVTVMLQAVFISGQLPAQALLVSDPQLPTQLVQEVETQAQQELVQFLDDRSNQLLATMTLLEASESANGQVLDIWLETDRVVDMASVVLKFDPQKIAFVDQEPTAEGIQLAWGDAPTYLKNRVDIEQGRLELTAQFAPQPFAGRMRLGSLVFTSTQPPQTIKFDFDYIEQTHLSSEARDADTGQNILTQPESFIF